MTDFPVFDGHNDLTLRLLRGEVTAKDVAAGLPDGHIDKPRARAGGFGGGMFAIFVPSPGDKALRHDEMRNASYDIPLPDPVPEAEAAGWTARGVDALEDLAAAGAVRICRTATEIEAALPAEEMAAVIHIEGAEGIDRDFARLHDWHARGLRSLGPVWSRETVWGHGVPFRYPSDPDTGPGLTEAGKALIAARHLAGQADRLIYCDDDWIMQPGWAAALLAAGGPGMAVTGQTWSIARLGRRGATNGADIAQGYSGVLVDPRWLAGPDMDPPDPAWPVDDVWLSGHLARQGIGLADAPAARRGMIPAHDDAHALQKAVVGGMTRDGANRACAALLHDRYGIWPPLS
jgi:hypothetical protein